MANPVRYVWCTTDLPRCEAYRVCSGKSFEGALYEKLRRSKTPNLWKLLRLSDIAPTCPVPATGMLSNYHPSSCFTGRVLQQSINEIAKRGLQDDKSQTTSLLLAPKRPKPSLTLKPKPHKAATSDLVLSTSGEAKALNPIPAQHQPGALKSKQK